jgi:hypothetical protein
MGDEEEKVIWEKRGAFIPDSRGLRNFSMTANTCSPDELGIRH